MDRFSIELNELLVGTYRSIVKVEEAMLKSLSRDQLSISEMHMLEGISKGGEDGRTITSLAQEMKITLPSVTMTVKKLEKKGYVTKERDGSDGRMVCVKLSRIGHRAEIAHRYFHRHMIKTITASIPKEEQAVLLRALGNLQTFLADKASELEGGNARGDEPR